MRQTQRGVARLSGLFTEDGAQEALLGGEVRLALGRDLTYQNISGVYLGTLLYDTVDVQIAQRIVADVLDLAGDLLRAELCISRLMCVDLNVKRGIYVVPYKVFVKQNGVLIVVAFPGHKADKGVLAERDLTV